MVGAYHDLCDRNEKMLECGQGDIDEGLRSDTGSSADEDGGDPKPLILERPTLHADDGEADFDDEIDDDIESGEPFAERSNADLTRVLCRTLS